MPDAGPVVAVIGAGAIAREFHLPALVAAHPASRVVVFDTATDRAAALAARFGARAASGPLAETLAQAAGVILTVPSRLHAPLALQALAAGAHVLVEKPLALTAGDAERVVAAAAAAGRTVTVNNTRRLLPAPQRVRELVATGALGRITGASFVQGEVFDWPAAGPTYFGPEADGKGVVQDVGAHVLDLLCWWIDRPLTLTRARGDQRGGPEAVADLRLAFEGGEAHVHLSWLSKLANTWRVEGTDGAVEGSVYDVTTLTVERGGRRSVERLPGSLLYGDYAGPLVRNFLEVIVGRAEPLIAASAVLPSIRLIDAYYATRQPFAEPWFDAWAEALHG